MMLERTQFNPALGWVREDLDDCLEVVRDNLETYARNHDDTGPLENVLAQLDRLKLTFGVMVQEGATMLCSEMIATGENMLRGETTSVEESLNALTDAVIVLPSQKVTSSRRLKITQSRLSGYSIVVQR